MRPWWGQVETSCCPTSYGNHHTRLTRHFILSTHPPQPSYPPTVLTHSHPLPHTIISLSHPGGRSRVGSTAAAAKSLPYEGADATSKTLTATPGAAGKDGKAVVVVDPLAKAEGKAAWGRIWGMIMSHPLWFFSGYVICYRLLVSLFYFI